MARGKRTAQQIRKSKGRGWAAFGIGALILALGVRLCGGSYASSEIQFDIGFVLAIIGATSMGVGAIILTANSTPPHGNGNNKPRTS